MRDERYEGCEKKLLFQRWVTKENLIKKERDAKSFFEFIGQEIQDKISLMKR